MDLVRVEESETLIESLTEEGDLVVDPFLGSGIPLEIKKVRACSGIPEEEIPKIWNRLYRGGQKSLPTRTWTGAQPGHVRSQHTAETSKSPANLEPVPRSRYIFPKAVGHVPPSSFRH